MDTVPAPLSDAERERITAMLARWRATVWACMLPTIELASPDQDSEFRRRVIQWLDEERLQLEVACLTNPKIADAISRELDHPEAAPEAEDRARALWRILLPTELNKSDYEFYDLRMQA
jgi:hypothetical protein